MVTQLGFGVLSHALLGPRAVPSNLTTALGAMAGESVQDYWI